MGKREDNRKRKQRQKDEELRRLTEAMRRAAWTALDRMHYPDSDHLFDEVFGRCEDLAETFLEHARMEVLLWDLDIRPTLYDTSHQEQEARDNLALMETRKRRAAEKASAANA